MLELVAQFRHIVVLTGEPDVWLRVHPDTQRIDTRDQNPLTNIELLLEDYEWPLNVFLSDITGVFCCADYT